MSSVNMSMYILYIIQNKWDIFPPFTRAVLTLHPPLGGADKQVFFSQIFSLFFVEKRHYMLVTVPCKNSLQAVAVPPKSAFPFGQSLEKHSTFLKNPLYSTNCAIMSWTRVWVGFNVNKFVTLPKNVLFTWQSMQMTCWQLKRNY